MSKTENEQFKKLCSVIAVADVCAVTIAKANKTLEAVGQANVGDSNARLIQKACEQLGKKVDRVPPSTITRRYPSPHKDLAHVTSRQPKRFSKVWRDGNNYLLIADGEVVPVVNGEVHDLSQGRVLRADVVLRVAA